MSGGPKTEACQQFRDGTPAGPALAARTFGGPDVNTIRNRTIFVAVTVTAGLVVALGACGSDGSGTRSAGSGTDGAARSTSPSASAAGTAGDAGTTDPTGTAGGSSARKSSSGSGTKTDSGSGSKAGSGSAAGGGNATSDGYAYKHPCAAGQLSVGVTTPADASGRRVIAVRNNGANACGLSYYPQVHLDGSGGRTVKPLIPGGLGGAPAYPVYAGRTAYAVIDLDPSGATSGTVTGIDELNVLADGDHMPDADTRNFPLGSGALVLKPKLGLYRSTVADAVASMKTADTPA